MKANKFNSLPKFIFVFYLIAALWSESLGTQSIQMIDLDEDIVTQYPHNVVLSLTSFWEGTDDGEAGTGFLIDNHFALTAAHVVIKGQTAANKVSCRIKKPRDNNSQVEDISVMVKEIIYLDRYNGPKKNVSDRSAPFSMIAFDYALLYLHDEINYDNYIKPVCHHMRSNDLLFLGGYPENASSPHEFNAPLEECMILKGGIRGGMSGSPIRFLDDQRVWNAIAILSGVNLEGTKSYACLFTKETMDRILNWKTAIRNEPNFFTHGYAVSRHNGIAELCDPLPDINLLVEELLSGSE